MKKILIIVVFFLGLLQVSAQRGTRYADSIIRILPQIKDDTARISALNEIAFEFAGSSPVAARDYAQQAMLLSEKTDSDAGRFQAGNVIGLSYYHSAVYDSALIWFRKCQTLAEKMQDKRKLSASLNNIGLVHDDRAEYSEALQYYFRSLSAIEGDPHSRQEAGTINNIALIYQTQGNYDQALLYHEKALKIKEALGNQRAIGNSLHNLGLVYKLKGNYAKSLEYYQKALAVRKKAKDDGGVALTLNNIGSVYEAQEQYSIALPYFLEALRMREELKDEYNLAITLFSLGTNYCNRGDYTEGYKYLDRAMEISKRIGARELLKYGYENLAAFAYKQGDFQKAFDYQKSFIAVKDSILNADTKKQMNELQTRFHAEQQKREIELLSKNNTIAELQNHRNRLFILALSAGILLAIALSFLMLSRYRHKKKANEELAHRNAEITMQKKEITDSINYAKRIQESILPPQAHWDKMLPDSFIFYRPKDIVSGDFYWAEQRNDLVCFAAVDCTGHGVPGALMSVVGFNLLTQAVNELGLTKPSDILKHLDAGVTKTLRQSDGMNGVKDGMDLSLCTLNRRTGELQYAGAFNSLYYVSGGILNEIKADKYPIGVNPEGHVDEYTNHSLRLKPGDCVYLFSDGYADQFGGPKGKKFKYNQLKELLFRIHTLPMKDQKAALASEFDGWKGQLEQIDDVVVLGVRI
jgi:serine phosphatase RsbU (regulator of sigma subunit)